MKASFDEAMAEIRKNFKAYQSMEKELERDHFGRIAMFHEGELVSTYNDRGDAYDIGCKKFGLGRFALKRIGEKPASPGAGRLYVQPMSITAQDGVSPKPANAKKPAPPPPPPPKKK